MDQKYDIFISYRRKGGEALACLLAEKLTQLGYSVFYDVESIRAGKFGDRIISVLEQCKDVIAVLSEHGLDRCVNEDDWIRKELNYSIANGKNIIPVVMRGFSWPENLPNELNPLLNYNAVSANLDYFNATFKKLISMLSVSKSREFSDGEYFLIYYSFSPFFSEGRVTSKLFVDSYSNVTLQSYVKEDGTFEYQYHGIAVETENNIYLYLNNDVSSERVFIVLVKSAGSFGRYIGLLSGLTPSMIPVCFKCVCVRPEDYEKINTKMLKFVLKHENREWTSDLLTLESSQVNLFYSEPFLGNTE